MVEFEERIWQPINTEQELITVHQAELSKLPNHSLRSSQTKEKKTKQKLAKVVEEERYELRLVSNLPQINSWSLTKILCQIKLAFHDKPKSLSHPKNPPSSQPQCQNQSTTPHKWEFPGVVIAKSSKDETFREKARRKQGDPKGICYQGIGIGINSSLPVCGVPSTLLSSCLWFRVQDVSYTWPFFLNTSEFQTHEPC